MEGFVFVDGLLKLRQFQRYSEDDIRRVVADNDKKRFTLRDDPATNRLQIRANQGHTIKVGDLTFLINPSTPIIKSGCISPTPGGILQSLGDGDHGRLLLGLNFFISRFFWAGKFGNSKIQCFKVNGQFISSTPLCSFQNLRF